MAYQQATSIPYTERAAEQSTWRGDKRLLAGGQSLKLSTTATVFKRVSLLIEGAKDDDWGGAGPPLAPALTLQLKQANCLSVLCFSAILFHRIGSPNNLFIINLFQTFIWIMM